MQLSDSQSSLEDVIPKTILLLTVQENNRKIVSFSLAKTRSHSDIGSLKNSESERS